MKGLFWTIIFITSSFVTQASTDIIRFVDATSLRNNPNNQYFIAVLDLALQKSQNEYGDYMLQPIDMPIVQKRHFVELSLGRIDVFWTMASEMREQFARSITIPLAFGSYGIRVLATNKAAEQKFSDVSDIVSLNDFFALSGSDWPDTKVLQNNGLLVDSERDETEFYRLVNQSEKYYYPRAITEVYAEQEKLTYSNVIVDTQLVLMYPAVMYFYVANDKVELAKRLEKGLRIALEDGSLKALFFTFKHHKQAFELARLKNRRFIYLSNPTLPKDVDVNYVRQLQELIINEAQ